jgi:hypothetical protein
VSLAYRKGKDTESEEAQTGELQNRPLSEKPVILIRRALTEASAYAYSARLLLFARS